MHKKSTKPTILFILHLPPPVHGAAMVGKYISESRVINDAFDCHYINLTTASSLADIGKITIRKVKSIILLLSIVRDKVKRLKPQLVYITANAKGPAFYKDFMVVQMLKYMKCKVVVHYHNKGVSTMQYHWKDDKLYRIFYKNVKVILLTDSLYKDVEKYVRRENVYICPNGIPKTLNSETFCIKHDKEVTHLLFLSNLLVSKGVIDLLDALKIIADKGYAFVCDFVGGETKEINSTRFVKEIKMRELGEKVRYLGKKYGEEKNDEYKKSDIFVFPTYYPNECFPLVLLEAMQYGLPCISTTEGGIPDIVVNGETGYLTKKRDSYALADKIEFLITHPEERRRMGENGRRKFDTEFTIDRFEVRMEEILDKIIFHA